MKNNLLKNVLFNVAAGVLAFAISRYFHVATAQFFGLLAVAGIGLIALHDYRPRRRLQVKVSPAKPATRRVVRRRRVSALIAA